MTRKIEVINYSEFATLANCETQWGFAYLLGQEEERDGKTDGLHLGTLLHLGLDRWTLDLGATLPTTWTDDINTGGKPGEVRTLCLTDFDPALVQLAEWLLRRYEQVYGSSRPESWNVISTEEWLTAKIKVGSRTVRVVGRHDGLIEIMGDLWLIERKSYGQRGRLDTVGVELQPTIYEDLIEQKYGRRPVGIMYDGIYTHQFVPKKKTQAQVLAELPATHPVLALKKAEQRDYARAAVEADPGIEREASASFERQWVDRTPQALEMGRVVLSATIRRRDRIKTLDDTVPHIGRHCSWCGFKNECWFRLSGVTQDIELVEGWEDSDEPV